VDANAQQRDLIWWQPNVPRLDSTPAAEFLQSNVKTMGATIVEQADKRRVGNQAGFDLLEQKKGLEDLREQHQTDKKDFLREVGHSSSDKKGI
jgi:hypothetical protein